MKKQLKDNLTWDDVDRYTTNEEKAKAKKLGLLVIVPFAIIAMRKEQEQLETNTNDINSIKDELTEIKTMLRTLIDGR